MKNIDMRIIYLFYKAFIVLKIKMALINCSWSMAPSKADYNNGPMVLVTDQLGVGSLVRLGLKETLRWRHNDHAGVSNHQPHGCLSIVYSGVDQRKHQSSTSLAFVRGIHRDRWINSAHKGLVTRIMFPFDDGIMVRKINPGTYPQPGKLGWHVLPKYTFKLILIIDLWHNLHRDESQRSILVRSQHPCQVMAWCH